MVTKMKKFGVWGTSIIPLIANVALTPAVEAQRRPQEVPVQDSPAPAPTAKYQPSAPLFPGDPGGVMLSDLPARGAIPRAANTANIQADTPVINSHDLLALYPQLAANNYAGYRKIVEAVGDICNQGYTYLDQLYGYDKQMEQRQIEYNALVDVFNLLPRDVKRGTQVMTIAQAAATGALCLLSGGFYCLAAIVTGIANIFTSFVNKHLQLANIRLSLTILEHARTTAATMRTWLQQNAWWTLMAMRYCEMHMPRSNAPASATPNAVVVPPAAIRYGQ